MSRKASITRRNALKMAGVLGCGALLAGCEAQNPGTTAGPDGDEVTTALAEDSPSTGSASDAPGETSDADAAVASANAVDGAAETYWIYNPSGMRESGKPVDTDLVKTRDSLGLTWPPLGAQASMRVEQMYTSALDADVTSLFYLRGWTDGLPVIAPTEQAVSLMLRGTVLSREETLATLAPLSGVATVEKVAVNAVMAGCAPAHLPVVLAAVQAVAEPEYDLVGVSTTTSPNASMIIVNGPIAQQLDINAGANALGRGRRANAVISRALHLVEQNVGGAWPAISDYSSLGTPGDFCMMLAENEEESPWESWAVERGFGADENVVTVASAEGTQLIVDIGVNGEGFLHRVAHHVTGSELLFTPMLLILTPTTAAKLYTEGWDKASIREFVEDHARVPASYIEAASVELKNRGGGEKLEDVDLTPDKDGLVKLPFVKSLHIVVAGGEGEKNMLVPLWSEPVAKTAQLPKAWDDVLELSEERGLAFA